jgi:hypothetical protein
VDPVLAAALGGQVKQVQVNTQLVQVLADMLEKARRGEIHSMVAVCISRVNLLSFDVIACENLIHAMIAVGGMSIVEAKISQSAIAQQMNVKSSPIIRPPAGMSL